MIRFDRVKQHPDWDLEARGPGLVWLAQNPYAQRADKKARPPDYYTGKGQKFRQALKRGFRGLCAYTAVVAPVATIDHFEGWADVRGSAREDQYYDWSNLRYCSDWVNRAKKGQWPDPFVIQDDWFELILPSLELVATDKVPPNMQASVSKALEVLGQSQNAIDAREGWWVSYRKRKLPFNELKRNAPILAKALLRQPRWLTKGDRKRFIARTL